MTGCVGLPTNLQGPGGTHVRTIALVAAMLAFSACDSSPKSQPAPASPGGSRPTTPAAVASPADGGPGPVVSPNNSVRRAKPDEVSAGRAPLASECEGDACGVVTVTWLDPGYRFENTSRRDVAITIWFAAKGDCLLSEFSIAPSKSSGWGNVGFCKPYKAGYK